MLLLRPKFLVMTFTAVLSLVGATAANASIMAGFQATEATNYLRVQGTMQGGPGEFQPFAGVATSDLSGMRYTNVNLNDDTRHTYGVTFNADLSGLVSPYEVNFLNALLLDGGQLIDSLRLDASVYAGGEYVARFGFRKEKFFEQGHYPNNQFNSYAALYEFTVYGTNTSLFTAEAIDSLLSSLKVRRQIKN